MALTVGADDVDGIATVNPGVLGARENPIKEIEGNIRAAALEAVERDGRSFGCWVSRCLTNSANERKQ